MYRFEKKATLVCAAASLITACCLPLSANVAFAQDSVEAQSIESKADFSSVVSDDLQPDKFFRHKRWLATRRVVWSLVLRKKR